MNALRYNIFSTRLKVPSLMSLPPTDDSLAQHLKRAHIQAMLWQAADRNQPPNVCLCDYGLEMSGGTPSPVRASKPVGPPELTKVIACRCSSDTPCRRKNCSCSSTGLSCMTFCKCGANTDLYQNTFTIRSVNEVDEEDSDAVEDDS